jgi:hypothetical protein
MEGVFHQLGWAAGPMTTPAGMTKVRVAVQAEFVEKIHIAGVGGNGGSRGCFGVDHFGVPRQETR